MPSSLTVRYSHPGGQMAWNTTANDLPPFAGSAILDAT
jgi:hypothetical protein